MSTQFTRQPNEWSRPAQSPTAMLCKSGVCIACIAGLAWIGFSTMEVTVATDPSVNATGAAAGTAFTADRAAEHRREVFEERRARFERRVPAQVALSAETPDR